MNDIDEIGMQTAKATAAMLAIAKLVQERTRERGQKEAELRMKFIAAQRKHQQETREAALRTKKQEKALDPRNTALTKLLDGRGKVSLAKEPLQKMAMGKDGFVAGVVGHERDAEPMSPEMHSVRKMLQLDNARSPLAAVRAPIDRTRDGRTEDEREKGRERER